jgi:DNA-binding transcriptional MerR regulator
MLDPGSNLELPAIPAKRYFTIGEVSELCAVKPHVLRYWETEFASLKPVKRRGNRRYYQRNDVFLVREIRSLLYEQGFTTSGARARIEAKEQQQSNGTATAKPSKMLAVHASANHPSTVIREIRAELEQVLQLLNASTAIQAETI